jgi:hypothetical protein
MSSPDRSVAEHIERLVAEEHRLLDLGGQEHGLAAEQHERLATVKIALDRVWDLVRQRRALRDAGLDPPGASERAGDTIDRNEG